MGLNYFLCSNAIYYNHFPYHISMQTYLSVGITKQYQNINNIFFSHNDLAFFLRLAAHNQFNSIDLHEDLSKTWPKSQTDILRMRKGLMGAQVRKHLFNIFLIYIYMCVCVCINVCVSTLSITMTTFWYCYVTCVQSEKNTSTCILICTWL